MKDVTCINPKSYRLTENQVYQASSEGAKEGYYFIINNAGRQVQYAQDLFEDVAEPEPEVIPDTVDQIMANSRITTTENNVMIAIVIDGETINRRISLLTSSGRLSISCGIHAKTNLNAFSYSLRRLLEEDFVTSREGLAQRLGAEVVKTAINKTNSTGMLVLSTNINDANFEVVDGFLTDLSATTHETFNPNSDNRIKLWVIDVSEQFIEEEDDEDTE